MIKNILILILMVCLGVTLIYSQSGTYRSGVFLHHSPGYNYWATGLTNTVPSEIVKYNTAHGYTGNDAVTFKRQGFPPSGDNDWFRWHMMFDSPGGYEGYNVFPIIAANKIVMIKSSFPSSDMTSEGNASDTLTPRTKSTYNYKWHWRSIIRVMSSCPDNFFVIWTNNPQTRGTINYSTAQRSHRFCKWAKDTLAAGLDPIFGAFPRNVYVFDIFHKVANDSGYIPYPQYAISNMNSHPNPAAADLVAPMIVREVFDAAIAYEGGVYNNAGAWPESLKIPIVNHSEKPYVLTDYSLNNIYPNPFNPTTTIEYEIPVDAWVKLAVYNVLGQEINVLYDGEQTAGIKTVQWNAIDNNGNDVSSGLYYLRFEAITSLECQHFIQVGKMCLIR